MILKDFQQKAVEDLSNSFIELWKTGSYKLPLVFKAPTGAGKTIVMADFLKTLSSNEQFDADKAFVWISFGGDDSYLQSKDKLYHYYNDGVDMSLKDKNDLSHKELETDNIFFINWSKIKASAKDGRVLRRENERTSGDYGVFDEYIKNTRKNRDLVLIIDEAHTETNTSLSDEVIELLNPRIIINVTATPKNVPSAEATAKYKAGFVFVDEQDVIDSGLIKSKIIIQTQEEINAIRTDGLGEDEIMLELAMKKREKLKAYYQDLGLDINPLVLIQLPSDMNETVDKETKKSSTLRYLKEKGVADEEIAVWLASEKTDNLEFITNNNNEVNFLLFKVAVATGWDCPRAQVLVMFREIKSPSFHTQIIGRVKRMPEAKHYDNKELNWAYLYTNYNKDHIQDVENTGGNKPPIYYTKIRDSVKQVKLIGAHHKRIDQNALEPHSSWQKHCISVLNENMQDIKDKIDFEVTQIENTILVDTVLDSFDSFITDLRDKAKETKYYFSKNDVEKLYNLLCITELKNQEKDEAKYNPTRSWGELKKALNVWFANYLHIHKEKSNVIIVNDLLKTEEQSVLRGILHKALVSFRKIYQKDLKQKEKATPNPVNIPPIEQSFTDDYEIVNDIKKNAYTVFYDKKGTYNGKINERKFIDFIERQDSVLWWNKQGDSGSENFAVEYYDEQEKKLSLFYIDFIIRTQNKLFIIDTKGGITAKETKTKNKTEALQKWIKEHQNEYDIELVGGIVMYQSPQWLLNSKDEYIYENDRDWDTLKF